MATSERCRFDVECRQHVDFNTTFDSKATCKTTNNRHWCRVNVVSMSSLRPFTLGSLRIRSDIFLTLRACPSVSERVRGRHSSFEILDLVLPSSLTSTNLVLPNPSKDGGGREEVEMGKERKGDRPAINYVSMRRRFDIVKFAESTAIYTVPQNRQISVDSTSKRQISSSIEQII